jgi:hypothetical protein
VYFINSVKLKLFIMKKMIQKLIVPLFAILVLVSCEKDDATIPAGEGKVTVTLTDAPFPFEFVTHANIGVAKVEVKTANGEFVTLFEGSTSYNMVNLTNGVTAEVKTTNIEAGTYVEARVTLDDASVELANGMKFNLNSAATGTTTITIEPELVVEGGATSEVLFDLDIDNSFKFKHSGGGYFSDWISTISSITNCDFDANFRVCDLDRTGKISGEVTVDGNAEKNAQVYVSVDGHKIYTHTKADGTFTFIGITPGTYTVYINTENGKTAQARSIVVSEKGTATCTVTVN